MRTLAKAALGIGIPLVGLALLVSSMTPRPREAPPPVAFAEPARGTGAAVELVGSPAGRWEVEDGFLGYRVVEHYPRLRDAYEGVGRTEAVTATLTVEDHVLIEADVQADLRELESGETTRDQAIRSRYLETREHPFATFTLTEPVALPTAARPAEPFDLVARGSLMIRDVTRTVDFPLQARWDGDVVQVIGALPVDLGDWDVEAPDIAGFVRVDEAATIEVDLTFWRA